MKPTMEKSNAVSVTSREKQSLFSESFMSYKTMIVNLKDNNSLYLRFIKEDDVESLAQALKGTQITRLDLSNSNLGRNGLNYLTQVLRDTQITSLNLSNSNIMDEGAKYLAECLKDSQITSLDLRKNKIGLDAAQYLNMMLDNTKIVYLYLDIHFTEGRDVTKYISQRSRRDTKYYWILFITLYNNKIGVEGAQYLNKICQNNAIAELTLLKYLEADDVQYLAQAFKNSKISEFRMSYNNIMKTNAIQFLVQAFKESQIYLLNVNSLKIGTTGAKYLAEFLREVKVLSLDLGFNYIGVEGMKYIASAIENSDIMNINLEDNYIEDEGAGYLSEILENSKICCINLNDNDIEVKGTRYLEEVLPNSQVTDMDPSGTMKIFALCQYIDANLHRKNCINLHRNIEERLAKGAKLWPYSIPEYNTPTDPKICHVFKELVSLNHMSKDFEFIVPRQNPPVDIDQYAFFIRTLNDNPNSKVHIFKMMCLDHRLCYDFITMNKINEFIAMLPNKFNEFIDTKLPEFIESFDNYKYVNLVKQFEDMKLHDIVHNLLLHRILYYVDETQEILHPYIYKMLDKYSLPLYNEQLEPNKKEAIISYYRNHQEIEGVQEIIDMLGSDSS